MTSTTFPTDTEYVAQVARVSVVITATDQQGTPVEWSVAIDGTPVGERFEFRADAWCSADTTTPQQWPPQPSPRGHPTMPPFDYEAAFRAHSADDREASGATLEAIDLAVVEHLPGWSVVWAMTGGGCSGWYILPDTDAAKAEAPGELSFLLTGLAEETEATGDLSRGVMIGAYDDNGGWPSDDYRWIGELEGTPEHIAAEVVRYVRTTVARRRPSTGGGAA